MKTLWLQQFVKGRPNGEKIEQYKVDTKFQQADIGTKIRGQARLAFLLELNNLFVFDDFMEVPEIKACLVPSAITMKLGVVVGSVSRVGAQEIIRLWGLSQETSF